MSFMLVMLGSSFCFLEKLLLYSQRISSDLCLQLRKTKELPGRVYIPKKCPMKAERRLVQLWMLLGLSYSSQALAELGRSWSQC